MRQTSIAITQLPLWLLRLAGDNFVQDRFNSNPLLFASWYCLVERLIAWPEKAQTIINTERSKKISFERATTLLNKINYSLGKNNDVEHARLMLEGYALHEWFYNHHFEFTELIQDTIFLYTTISDSPEAVGAFGSRMVEFSQTLNLTKTEQKVLTLAIACTAFDDVRNLFEQITRLRQQNASHLWETMLDCTAQELTHALAPQGILRKSQLIQPFGSTVKLPTVKPFWIFALNNPMESLFDLLLKPLAYRAGAGLPARLSEEDMALATAVLQNAKGQGVNLLLYGADGLEKRALLRELLERAGKNGFVLQDLETGTSDLPGVAFVAQRLLFNRYGHEAVLVIEKSAYVLERKPNEFLRMMLGIELDSSQIKPFDELMLDTNPSATIWAGTEAEVLPEECVARFVFHAPLKKARRQERRAQLEQYISSLKLTKHTQDELLKLEDVSALQLETAIKAASLSGASIRKEREAAMVQAVRRSLKALHRETKTKTKECVTEYSLKYVNYAGKFGPLQIMKALQVRPRGSICLYGPPGTGKTQFVEHLAQQLGLPLISKRASDLLSKWVGENEKNIAKMFEEANNEEAILFLDEGDSFLIDRTRAEQNWQITQVNELLQHMERFEGIFIMATNLFTGLDAAALRRFTFKVEFRALDSDQRWSMFLVESGLKGHINTISKATRDNWWEQLCLMAHLTAGDFATVKRQALLLGETLTPEQWLEQLKIECEVKSHSTRLTSPRLNA